MTNAEVFLPAETYSCLTLSGFLFTLLPNDTAKNWQHSFLVGAKVHIFLIKKIYDVF
jgi:hypothetical protein